jgi:hypothetical protein
MSNFIRLTCEAASASQVSTYPPECQSLLVYIRFFTFSALQCASMRTLGTAVAAV